MKNPVLPSVVCFVLPINFQPHPLSQEEYLHQVLRSSTIQALMVLSTNQLPSAPLLIESLASFQLMVLAQLFHTRQFWRQVRCRKVALVLTQPLSSRADLGYWHV